MIFYQKNNSVIMIAQEKLNDSSMKQFYGAGKTHSLICKINKYVIPNQLQQTLVEW